MRTCKLCGGRIPIKIRINERIHNLQNRKYCLSCSPFQAHNTRRLAEPLTEASGKRMSAESQRAKFRRYQRKTRKLRKEKLIKMKGGRCAICGYDRNCQAARCCASIHRRSTVAPPAYASSTVTA